MTRRIITKWCTGLSAVSVVLGASLAAAVSVPAATLAQEPARLSLHDALTQAARTSPLLLSAASRRDIVAGRARAEAAQPNPVLEWRRENDRSVLLPDVFTTLALPVDLTGRRLGLAGAARAAERRAVAESLIVVREAGYAAARAWWRVALAQGLHDLARAQRQALEGIASYDSTRFAEGAVAEVVALRTRVEAVRARITEANAAGDVARSRTELARALGRGVDSLPRVSAIPDDSRPTLGDTGAVLAAARERPDVQAARLGLLEAQRRAGAERRYVLGGDVQLVGGVKRTQGLDAAIISAFVPMPVFNRNAANAQRASGELLLAQAEARDAETRATAEARAAVIAVAALHASAPDGAVGLARAGDDVASITAAAYREGAASLLELLESQRARADARATALRWRHDVALARLELDRAAGRAVSDTVP
jgi:outer membrane protein TolC